MTATGRTGPTGATGATGPTGDEQLPLAQEIVVERAKGEDAGDEVVRHLMMTQNEIDRRNEVNKQHRDGGNDTRARELAERISGASAAGIAANPAARRENDRG